MMTQEQFDIEVRALAAGQVPFAIILKCNEALTQHAHENLRTSFDRAWGDKPKPPTIIVDCGIDVIPIYPTSRQFTEYVAGIKHPDGTTEIVNGT